MLPKVPDCISRHCLKIKLRLKNSLFGLVEGFAYSPKTLFGTEEVKKFEQKLFYLGEMKTQDVQRPLVNLVTII